MKNLTSSIIGWLLLIGGLIIISFALYSSFNIFTGKTAPPQVFEPKPNATDISTSEQVPEEAQELVRQRIDKALPAKGFTPLLNMISWSILTGILIFGGSKLSGLGIKLLKD